MDEEKKEEVQIDEEVQATEPEVSTEVKEEEVV